MTPDDRLTMFKESVEFSNVDVPSARLARESRARDETEVFITAEV
jgi:hypothetical protein